MKKLVCVLGLLLIATLVARPAQASVITFETILLGSNENPPNNSPGFGSITLILDDVLGTLDVFETFSDLLAPTTAAHLHCCVGEAENGPVVLPFTGFPTGVTSGTFHHLFDLSTDLSGITVAAFIAGLEAGQVYANIHSQQFPGGEIRGQLSAVPEPGTMALLGIGLLVLGHRLRRRRA